MMVHAHGADEIHEISMDCAWSGLYPWAHGSLHTLEVPKLGFL